MGTNLINYVTFIGVVHHELSHALLAFLTGALPMVEASVWRSCLFDYVFLSIVLHMSLSKQDIQVMKGGIVVVILLLTIIFYGLGWDFVAQIESGNIMF